MATINEITTMCKGGRVEQAYQTALADLEMQSNVWTQRGVGWALYYLMKTDAEKHDVDSFVRHLEQLKTLDLLTADNDTMIYENVLRKTAEMIRRTQPQHEQELTTIFECIKEMAFSPSRTYSLLLAACLNFTGWPQLAEFIEWWNLDSLMPEDYKIFTTADGKKIIALAERAYITYAKALMFVGDKERMKAFLPRMEALKEQHPDMMYPGYFCGKLLIALGKDGKEALEKIIPFARKKATEFWVWQLLAEMFRHVDGQKQMACLLRASQCRAKEVFLGKVRTKLAALYIAQNDLNRARFHIDKVVTAYQEQGWRLPREVQDWTRTSWLQTAVSDSSSPMDYMAITNVILYGKTMQTVAIVTYVDWQNKRLNIVYGHQKRTSLKLKDIKVKVKEAMVFDLEYVESENGKIYVIGATIHHGVQQLSLSYFRCVEGVVTKKELHSFAFLKTRAGQVFVSPDVVKKYRLANAQQVKALTVLDYNRRKEEWTWNCVAIIK